jgi:uncharacterized membrane protein
MLSAIATSMVTVAGVVFSITIVTLSLTSTQYSPRVLRNFMRDRPTQVVLGVFVGIFAYCLVVLRTIRGGDEGTFIPSLSVLGGMAYAFVGIGVLIFFIHHVAQSIQAASILARIADDTAAAIDHLFPQDLGRPQPAGQGAVTLPSGWTPVRSDRNGYVQAIDTEAVLRLAVESGRVLRLCVRGGDYVSPGTTLLQASGDDLGHDWAERARGSVIVGRQRSVEQDVAFGLQQLVDVALRALSPGVNDSTTACMCLDQLGTLLARLAGRAMPQPLRFEDGQLRVVAPVPAFGVFLQESLQPVVRQSRQDVEVLAHALGALEAVRDAARSAERRRDLWPLVRELQGELATVRPRHRSRELRARLRLLRDSL